MDEYHILHIDIVWRLSEFAFFVRLLRWAHFLFMGVWKMECENYFCIYEQDGECILDDEISIGMYGTCQACIYPSVSSDKLEETKAQKRDYMIKLNKEWGLIKSVPILRVRRYIY